MEIPSDRSQKPSELTGRSSSDDHDVVFILGYGIVVRRVVVFVYRTFPNMSRPCYSTPFESLLQAARFPSSLSSIAEMFEVVMFEIER